jgi:hypothetical protein
MPLGNDQGVVGEYQESGYPGQAKASVSRISRYYMPPRITRNSHRREREWLSVSNRTMVGNFKLITFLTIEVALNEGKKNGE